MNGSLIARVIAGLLVAGFSATIGGHFYVEKRLSAIEARLLVIEYRINEALR